MDMNSLIWMIIFLSMFQPVVTRRLLEAQRQRLIALLEKKRKSRVVLLIHRQESMNLLGFPIVRYIDINDSEELIRAVRLTDPQVPIDLVLHTPGGLVLAAVQIARALKRHPAKVTVFVPHYAMSGGTLIALAADEIVMAEDAVLGPVDPQMGQMGAAASIVRAVSQKPVEKVEDATLILADQARMAIRQVKKVVVELLSDRFPKEKAEELAGLLAEGRWTHDHPIAFSEAKEMGLPVTTEIPEEVLSLMSYYRQPVRQQPSVEYLPTPRSAGREKKS
ncbi:MAG: ATP-dependent Clp protease proteolytic subunit [Verrucomicrobia bacterium]|nr:ATP-dependent Clp protease proteolytic subunit [Verrucomicrobiota bacterium]